MQRHCKMILSILIFMLVQGQVMSDSELFPVSMFEVDSGEHQPIDPQKNDEIEPLEGENATERSAKVPKISGDVRLDHFRANQIYLLFSTVRRAVGQEINDDVKPLKKEIADAYGFVKDPNKDQWKTLPSFKGQIGKRGWAAAAQLAEEFFRNNNNQETPWKHLLATRTPINLLYITAARYLFVTHVLWEKSNRRLVACKENRERYSDIIKSFKIPATGVCFPLPYGSATYKSDYDVGLIGKDSGTVTQSFNQYFQAAAPDGFGKPSELVLDTNVYAFTLEFAMPAMFPSLPSSFIFNLHRLEQMSWYKMQELASAYYKVFKYNNTFFEEMKEEAIQKMKVTGAERAMKHLQHWLKTFQDMDKQQALRQTNEISPTAFRLAHNNKYQEYLQSMSKYGGYDKRSTVYLAKALLYAAEAYHTRGAIRHVVQGMQMNAITTCQYYTPLSTYDLWVSMIENWGEANKEYQHCGNIPVADCLMKMSKYLSRMFDAMRVIRRTRLPKKDRKGLLDFGSTKDPELAINLLLRYKRSGEGFSPIAQELLPGFLQQFDCNNVSYDRKFPEACLKNIHDAVNAYNKVLAAKVNKINGLKTKLTL